MPYELKFSNRARSGLPALPEYAIEAIHQHLNALSESPSTLLRPPVSPPYPPFGHQYDFEIRHNGRREYQCVVFALYGDDGASLEIVRFVIHDLINGSITGTPSVQGRLSK